MENFIPKCGRAYVQVTWHFSKRFRTPIHLTWNVQPLQKSCHVQQLTCDCKASICFSRFFLASSSSSCCSCRLFFSSSSCLILLLRLSFWRVSSWSSSCYTNRHIQSSVWFIAC